MLSKALFIMQQVRSFELNEEKKVNVLSFSQPWSFYTIKCNVFFSFGLEIEHSWLLTFMLAVCVSELWL